MRRRHTKVDSRMEEMLDLRTDTRVDFMMARLVATVSDMTMDTRMDMRMATTEITWISKGLWRGDSAFFETHALGSLGFGPRLRGNERMLTIVLLSSPGWEQKDVVREI